MNKSRIECGFDKAKSTAQEVSKANVSGNSQRLWNEIVTQASELVSKFEYRGVAQLVARDVWEQDTGGDAPRAKERSALKSKTLKALENIEEKPL